MINKMIASIIFVSCLFALSLKLMGVDGPIQIGPEFRIFLTQTSLDLENFKIAIPDIPSIPEMSNVSGFLIVIDMLRQFFNGIINVLNFLIMAINSLIKVLEFLFLLIKNLITMRDKFITA